MQAEAPREMIRHAEFTPEREDIVHVYRMVALARIWRSIAFLLVMTVLLVVFAGASRDFDVTAMLITAVCGVVGGTLGLLGWYQLVLLRLARRIHAQQAIMKDLHQIDWDETGLSAETPRSRSRFAWTDYVRRQSNARMLLFYQSDLMVQFVPRRAVTDDQWADLQRLTAALPTRRSRRMPVPQP